MLYYKTWSIISWTSFLSCAQSGFVFFRVNVSLDDKLAKSNHGILWNDLRSVDFFHSIIFLYVAKGYKFKSNASILTILRNQYSQFRIQKWINKSIKNKLIIFRKPGKHRHIQILLFSKHPTFGNTFEQYLHWIYVKIIIKRVVNRSNNTKNKYLISESL